MGRKGVESGVGEDGRARTGRTIALYVTARREECVDNGVRVRNACREA